MVSIIKKVKKVRREQGPGGTAPDSAGTESGGGGGAAPGLWPHDKGGAQPPDGTVPGDGWKKGV